MENHVKIAESLNSCVSTVRTYIETMRSFRCCVPEICVQPTSNILVAGRDYASILDLDVREKRAEPVC